MLGNTLVVLVFFFICLAIAGNQLISGALLKRCVNKQDGKVGDWEKMCSNDASCDEG
jgi:hypothetical protein